MITLYQESVPFSNKRATITDTFGNNGAVYDGQVSSDKKYTNPVIIPYAVNGALGEDVLETVIYIKNDDQSKYYKNVVVSLMKEDATVDPPVASGVLAFAPGVTTLSLNATLNVPVELSYDYPGGIPLASVTMTNVYKTSYIPITIADDITVKFSYGYDELSYARWSNKKSVLLIPTIGTTGLGDTSYIPVRMRITTTNKIPLITNRNYFIDISFSDELNLGA